MVLRHEGHKLKRVVVCEPQKEYFHVADPKAHNIGQVADWAKAIDEHRHLQAILRQSGCRVVNIKELAGHPNSVFARDASLVTPRGYIKLRMGLRTRRGEEGWAAAAMDSLGVPCAGEIEEPGTVEGGDVILAGKVAFIGRSKRTNRSGGKQLSQLLAGMGYEVRTIVLPPAHLHIGGAMSIVSSEAVLCYRAIFPKGFFQGFRTIEIPEVESSSANVIALGDEEVIVEKSNSTAANSLQKAGCTVYSIDLSEFLKGRGGPTCLILPVDRTEKP
jgi:dimethylargininase